MRRPRRRSAAGPAPLPTPPRPNLATARPSATTTTACDAGDAPAPLIPPLTTPLGRITVRHIAPGDAGGAAVLVARAFAAAGSAPLGDVSSFVARCLGGGPDAPAGLVAVLEAGSTEGGGEEGGGREGAGAAWTAGPPPPPSSSFSFPPGRASVVVGFAAVAGPGRAAVDRAASDGGASPSALPPGAAVLTNVAVDPRARRCGVGRALVAGAEAVARAAGAGGLWLEPRPGPGGAAARALYAACGYEPATGQEEGSGAGAGLGGLLGRLARATQRTPDLLVKRF